MRRGGAGASALAALLVLAASAGMSVQAATDGVAASAASVADAAASGARSAPVGVEQDAASWIRFEEDDSASCVQRDGRRITVRNAHPTRTVRVWLDRVYMGTGTGDRSRSDLKPGGEPEPLGCSRVAGAAQAWKVVRAQYVD